MAGFFETAGFFECGKGQFADDNSTGKGGGKAASNFAIGMEISKRQFFQSS